MPKSKANARPYNRTQKKASTRNNTVLKKALKAGFGKATYSGTGPGRSNTSPGMSAQATRRLASSVDSTLAKRIKPRRGRRKTAK